MVRISAIGASVHAPITLGDAEKDLEASGLAWTHVRPRSFVQNFLGSIPTVVG